MAQESVAQDLKASKFWQFVADNQTRDSKHYAGSPINATYTDVDFATHDQLQINVGGIPKGGFLLMLPKADTGIKNNAILLEINDVQSLPQGEQIKTTVLEISKAGVDSDSFTNAELGWAGRSARIVGMYTKDNETAFGSDVPTMLSPQQYVIISPPDEIINYIINNSTSLSDKIPIGKFRPTESIQTQPSIPFFIPVNDLLGKRTGGFGLTRSGKSNLFKNLAHELDKFSETSGTSVGQLVIDQDGEWIIDNIHAPSLATTRTGRTTVYSPTPSKGQVPLKLDFYDDPNSAMQWIKGMLRSAGKDATYVEAFVNIELEPIGDLDNLNHGERLRARRKLLFYYCILYKAGFTPNESHLKISLDPIFKAELRDIMYSGNPKPSKIITFEDLLTEVERVAKFVKTQKNHAFLKTESGNDLFDADDKALLTFLVPNGNASGVTILAPVRMYHDPAADDAFTDILNKIDSGRIAIIDLSGTDESLDFLTEKIVSKIYYHQNTKLKTKTLKKDHYVQIYLEEAQNIFPAFQKDYKSIFEKLAKQGGKLLIGCCYITQSPSVCDKRFLDQTENVFVSYLNSMDEITFLCKINSKFELHKQEINNVKSKGYLRGITESTRFVVPFQATLFEGSSNAL